MGPKRDAPADDSATRVVSGLATRLGAGYVVLLLALMLCATPALASYSQSANIKVSLLSQDPDPVQAGSIVEARFKVENFGTKQSGNVSLELLAGPPFELLSKARVDIGSLIGLQNGPDGAVVKYRLAVDAQAPEGNQEVRVRMILGGTAVEPDPFNITVKTPTPILSVESVTWSPETIAAGQKGALDLAVKSRNAYIKNLRATLALAGTSLLPSGESAEQFIGDMPKGASALAHFPLIASTTATSGVESMLVWFMFEDRDGVAYTKNATLSAIIRNEPSYLVNIDDTEGLIEGKQGKLVISVSNTGAAEMRYAIMELLPNDAFDIISSPKLYLGNLASDDYETAEYTLHVKSTGDAVPVMAKLAFKDEFDQEYSTTATLPLTLYTTQQAIALGIITAPRNYLPVIIVLVVALVWWLLRRRKKK
ncbi:hypothetical protein COY28_01545 [Candidatus Woesearchaeota archaeon CG_4_10_14_0_2_um_filter_57_5]|nr:MAG: hypothetical protein AUJ68_07140 [Candidatus Woesearchaeota archaeon CG1_02_57_44]PIN70938.1 MAG: hypothetical protein COV94_00455 [Candidatus Woesearchaeota archaeon CG11_big_fil_rev_8_21_14_0_20_57_5]PIZ55774.1 MAG: hypothetical protein COY28_01545 [Candidatus Woesearchaeota archaeon CG_4_10_14_0_2_um_filter_57_5]